MQYRKIDLESYPRRAHFDYFSAMAYPYVGVTANVDISRLRQYQKESGAPFFLTMLYCASRAANAVPELRQRILDGGIIEYPICRPSHTVAKPDGTYAYCVLNPELPLDEFIARGREAQEECIRSGDIEEDDSALGCFFISSLPWLSYTAVVQPVPMPSDSNPRITWGKFFEENGKTLLPLSLLCHHALVDGLHISRFYLELEKEIAAL